MPARIVVVDDSAARLLWSPGGDGWAGDGEGVRRLSPTNRGLLPGL
jgi:hypothetical protein